MFFLLFFVFLIELFTYLIFEPLTSFLDNIFELRSMPIIALIAFVFLFSIENFENQDAG